jgi:hypothetical protein
MTGKNIRVDLQNGKKGQEVEGEKVGTMVGKVREKYLNLG